MKFPVEIQISTLNNYLVDNLNVDIGTYQNKN